MTRFCLALCLTATSLLHAIADEGDNRSSKNAHRTDTTPTEDVVEADTTPTEDVL